MRRTDPRSRFVIDAGSAVGQGRRLLIGAICLAATATLVGWLIAGPNNNGLLSHFDSSVTNALVRNRPTWLVHAARLTSSLGDVVGMVVVSLAAALLAARRRSGALWLLPPVATLGAALLAQVVKLTAGRPRPAAALRLTHETNYSMPSGHATTAAAAFGALAIVIALVAPRWRGWATGGAVALTALIAAARLVLGVHWLSDVVVGAALGAGWLAVCLPIARPRRAAVDAGPESTDDAFGALAGQITGSS